jgi:hypothetical protein
MKKIFCLLLIAIALPHAASAKVFSKNAISAEGEAYLIVKPDIAHCFIKIQGDGKSYALSKKAADEKKQVLNEIIKKTFNQAPAIIVIRTFNQPKTPDMEDNFNKQFYQGMAKAIKGEDLDTDSAAEDKPNEFSSIINVFFSIPDYQKNEIEKLKSDLAKNKIAFDKHEPYSFYYRTDLDKNFILFGLKEPSPHLESLAASAFEIAQQDADVIAQSTGKNVGDLIGISGCGGQLEGTTDFDDSVWIGKSLGPLSIDPDRLNIKFKKSFEFQLR